MTIIHPDLLTPLNNPSAPALQHGRNNALPKLTLRFLVDSFSHTLLWRSRACGLKVRLQMVQGRSVEGPSSGNSVGEITGGVLEVKGGASFGGFVLREKDTV